MDNMNNMPQSPQLEQEESIDWQLYINKVWNGRKLILIVTAIFIVLGFARALTMKRIWTTQVLLAPELNSNNNSSRLSGLAGIASMLGGNLQMNANISDAYNITMYPEVIASTPFIVGLFDIPVVDKKNDIDTTLVGYITRDQGFNIMALPSKAIGGIISFLSGKEKEEDAGFTKVDPKRLTKDQNEVVMFLQKQIVADVDKKSGETTITVTMDNPVIAATLADSICARLRAYITDYRTSKAREDYNYYQTLADEAREKYHEAGNAVAYYADHNHGLILQSVISEGERLRNNLSIAQQIYTQMAQQAEMARGKVQEEKPVFAVIQPATVPVKAANSRAKVLLIFTFLGFAGAVVWVLFGKEYLGIAKNMFQEAKSSK